MSKQSKRERQRLNREARRQYEEALARRRRMWRGARVFGPIAALIIGGGVYVSMSGSSGSEKSIAASVGCKDVKKPAPKTTTFAAAPPLTINPQQQYAAVIATSCGTFTIDLDASEAPQTVNSFVFLAQQGFYDGLGFHRIVKGFVVQGGDPKGDGTGGPGYTVPDEPPAGGYQQGSVAIANSGPGTSGSQFYIVSTDKGAGVLNQQKTSDGKYSYSILGQVTDGFDTIRRMNKLGTSGQAGTPRATVVIYTVTITGGPAGITTTTTAPAAATTTTAPAGTTPSS